MIGLNGCGFDRCPECNKGLNTYRHPGAKVWCEYCGVILQEEGGVKVYIRKTKAKSK
jgi:ribosomal protein S27E